MRSRWFGLVIAASTAGASLWAYPRLPVEVTLHGDGDGTSRSFLVLLIPVMIVVLWTLQELLPRIDPKRGNYTKFIDTYWRIANGSVLVLGTVHVVALGIGLGVDLDIDRVVLMSFGILLLLHGNYLPRVPPNWLSFGFKTPWSLSSVTVWRRTQRTASWLFVLAGLATLAVSLIWPRPTFTPLVLALLVVWLVLVVQSYVLWRREQQG